MTRICQTVASTILILFLAFFSSDANAAQGPSFPVDWQQDNINWNQLQALFNENPNYNNFNIRFPNGTNWNVDAAVMQAMHLAYLHHADLIGYKGEVPDLMFSSLNSKYKTEGGFTSVPISKFSDNLQASEMDLLNQLDYQKYSFWASLPSWLQSFLTMVWNGLTAIWDYASDWMKKWID